MDGILEIETSFKKGRSEIKFDPSKINIKKIKNSIESKGYIIKPNER